MIQCNTHIAVKTSNGFNIWELGFVIEDLSYPSELLHEGVEQDDAWNYIENQKESNKFLYEN